MSTLRPSSESSLYFTSIYQPHNLARIFSRPYPQATAGVPLSLSYDPYSRVMEFHFLPNLQILSATEIFVPPLVYTDGYNVEVSSNLEWETKAMFKNKILVTAFSDEEGVVRITPVN